MTIASPLLKICEMCGASFAIIREDLAFYDRLSPVFNGVKHPIPSPRLCPGCRECRRFSFRNESSFSKRSCDSCGKEVISLYSPDKPYTVYCQDCWWSDAYDPTDYGIGFDFNRSFFEQYDELNRRVPKLAIQNANSENCAYTNYSSGNKDCYLVVGTGDCENCFYSYRLFNSRNLFDCYDVVSSENCYECMESENISTSFHCRGCKDSARLLYSQYCTNCQDCIGCINLSGKQYHIFNVSYSKEEFEARKSLISADLVRLSHDFMAFRSENPYRSRHIFSCTDSTGNQLNHCNNCHACFTFRNSQSCSYSSYGEGNTDSYDMNFGDNCELQLDSTNLESNHRVLFSFLAWYVTDGAYLSNCFHCRHVFGCSGMKNGEYRILNRQYTKEEYEHLLPRIIEHMGETGEWGEFFPSSISAFGYNETVAMFVKPLTRESALGSGFVWSDHEAPPPQVSKIIPSEKIPDDIRQIPDDILHWAIECEVTGRPYRILKQELEFYRKFGLPIPKRHPDVRHSDRMGIRSPRTLQERSCDKCGSTMSTPFPPDRAGEMVYCEQCYDTSFIQ